jgi:minor extracellular serine protease Vpr
MATPHVAGSAAVLKQLHPSWSPDQIKSALVNSAKRPVGRPDNGNPLDDPMARGGGRIDLGGAATTPFTIDPVSVSFGLLIGNKPDDTKQRLAVQNVSGTNQSCETSVTQDSGGPPLLSVSPNALTVSSGGTATLVLHLSAPSSVPSGAYFGDAVINCGGSPVLRVPWWIQIQRQP